MPTFQAQQPKALPLEKPHQPLWAFVLEWGPMAWQYGGKPGAEMAQLRAESPSWAGISILPWGNCNCLSPHPSGQLLVLTPRDRGVSGREALLWALGVGLCLSTG